MTSRDITLQLKQAFGCDELAWLRRRLRKRLERDGTVGERLLVESPTMEERRSVERLLGRPGEFGKHLSIRIADLQAILTPLGAPDLRVALEALEGPIVSNQQRRAQEQAQWAALIEELEYEFAGVGIESRKLLGLLESGILKRATGTPQAARTLLLNVVRVQRLLIAIPTSQEKLCRAELAARALGDSHALDVGLPLLSILKRLYDLSGSDDYEFWKALNITTDETSSTVLTLNLKFAGGDLAPALNAFAAAGEPCRITLKTIERGLISDVNKVFICENPAILHAAATRLGAKVQPIICSEGQPSLACQKLLILLSSSRTQLCYHGDFDWGGIKIANFLLRQFPNIVPWRFKTPDYELLSGGFTLQGESVQAIWDPGLSIRMEQRNQGFHEEMILSLLLEDLGRP